MKLLGKDIVRHLGRLLQYAPAVIAFFLALSSVGLFPQIRLPYPHIV